VIKSQQTPTPERLEAIFHDLNARRGANAAGDVSVAQLQLADVAVWETMQKEAEEKDKRYVCVVWTAEPVTRSHLERLEAASRGDIDANGRACLQVGTRD